MVKKGERMIKIVQALSKKEGKELGIKGKQIFLGKIKNKEVLIVDKEILYIKHEGKIIPTLWNEEIHKLPKITVDIGAIKPIASGADVLRPGIVEWEKFEKGEPVVVVEERHKTPIAIGISLMDSDELERVGRGKVIKTIHHIGDEIWEERKK